MRVLHDEVHFKSDIPTFKEDRICRHHGCNTVLSIYNPTDMCYIHDRERRFAEFDRALDNMNFRSNEYNKDYYIKNRDRILARARDKAILKKKEKTLDK